MNKNAVSVLMSVYNEPVCILDRAIRSILDQTYQDFEYIIILDNPDNQEAIRLIEGYKDSRIHFYVNKVNMGLVKSLNRGISLCSGEVIVRMDADDISLPDRIENQLDFMNAKKADIIGTDIEVMNEECKQGKIIVCPRKNSTIIKALRHDNCVKHPTWMVKKSVYESLKGYRDVFSCEDFDFLLRAVMAGYRLGNAPFVGLRYRQNPYSISRKNRAYQQTVFEYLGKNYMKGEIPSEESIEAYLSSVNTQKKMNRFEKYNKKEKNDIRIVFDCDFYKTIYHRLMYKYYVLVDKQKL